VEGKRKIKAARKIGQRAEGMGQRAERCDIGWLKAEVNYLLWIYH
jgi:hypothetical protein